MNRSTEATTEVIHWKAFIHFLWTRSLFFEHKALFLHHTDWANVPFFIPPEKIRQPVFLFCDGTENERGSIWDKIQCKVDNVYDTTITLNIFRDQIIYINIYFQIKYQFA